MRQRTPHTGRRPLATPLNFATRAGHHAAALALFAARPRALARAGAVTARRPSPLRPARAAPPASFTAPSSLFIRFWKIPFRGVPGRALGAGNGSSALLAVLHLSRISAAPVQVSWRSSGYDIHQFRLIV